MFILHNLRETHIPKFSCNFEVKASELQEYLEDMFLRNALCSNRQPHSSVLPVAKALNMNTPREVLNMNTPREVLNMNTPREVLNMNTSREVLILTGIIITYKGSNTTEKHDHSM